MAKQLLSDISTNLLIQQARYEAFSNGDRRNSVWKPLEERLKKCKDMQSFLGTLYGGYGIKGMGAAVDSTPNCAYNPPELLLPNTYIRAIEGIGGTEGLIASDRQIPPNTGMPLNFGAVYEMWNTFWNIPGKAETVRVAEWLAQFARVEGRGWELSGHDEVTLEAVRKAIPSDVYREVDVIYQVFGEGGFDKFRTDDNNGVHETFVKIAFKYFSLPKGKREDTLAGVGKQTQIISRNINRARQESGRHLPQVEE